MEDSREHGSRRARAVGFLADVTAGTGTVAAFMVDEAGSTGIASYPLQDGRRQSIWQCGWHEEGIGSSSECMCMQYYYCCT
jgi:hypothetical protein